MWLEQKRAPLRLRTNVRDAFLFFDGVGLRAPPGGDYQLLGEGIPLVHPQIMIALVITLIALFPTPALVYGSITPRAPVSPNL